MNFGWFFQSKSLVNSVREKKEGLFFRYSVIDVVLLYDGARHEDV